MDSLFLLDSAKECPLYGLQLEMDQSHLFSISFVINGDHPAGMRGDPESKIQKLAMKELRDFFAGRLQAFTVPIELRGTDFQKKVWSQIALIPYGETRTYKEIAEAVGGANLARAVGGAANRNPIPVIVPCHRVVGTGGSLTGFAAGVGVKRFLLELERRHVG